MNANEEIAMFQFKLGRAIAQWGYVEGQLLHVLRQCVDQPNREALAIGYLLARGYECPGPREVTYSGKQPLAPSSSRPSGTRSRVPPRARGWVNRTAHE